MKNVFLITIIIISTLTSCNIQKKRYSRGFTISKNRNYISSVKKKKDVKSNQNFEILKISPPAISKVNQEPVITNIVTENKVEFTIKNEGKLEVVNIHKSEEEEQVSTKLAVNTKGKELDNSNIKRNQSKRTFKLDTPKKPVNKNSIIALIFCLIPIVGFILAFIFAFKALNQIKESPNKYRKSSKTLAIIATVPFYIIVLSLLFTSLVLAVSYGLVFLLITIALLLLAVLPILSLNYLNPEKNINDEVDPIKPEIEEKTTPKNKKSISKSNKLLIFFILLFGSMLLIPLAFNS